MSYECPNTEKSIEMQTLTNTEEGFDESDAHLLINKTCPTKKLSNRPIRYSLETLFAKVLFFAQRRSNASKAKACSLQRRVGWNGNGNHGEA